MCEKRESEKKKELNEMMDGGLCGRVSRTNEPEGRASRGKMGSRQHSGLPSGGQE